MQRQQGSHLVYEKGLFHSSCSLDMSDTNSQFVVTCAVSDPVVGFYSVSAEFLYRHGVSGKKMHEIDSKHVSVQLVTWTARQVYRSTLMSATTQERHNLRPSENCILKSNSMDFGTLHKWESAGGTG
jgi:hypothetical protein